jgi:hypothetical protein
MIRLLLLLLSLATPAAAAPDWHCNAIAAAKIAPGEGYASGPHRAVALEGGSGGEAVADITVGPNGAVADVKIESPGRGFAVGDVLTAPLPGGSGFSLTVTALHSFALGDDGKVMGRKERGASPCR